MSFELHILGSNSAAFAYRRHHTSQLLKINNQNFLIDCGEGTQLLLKKYGIKISRINHVFISHLHGDHYFGLIGLLSTMHLFGRKTSLNLVGPPGLAEIISLQLRYSETNLNYKINFIEWVPGEVKTIFEDDFVKVDTIPMDHRIPCSGFLFREKPKKRRLKRDVAKELGLSVLDINRLKSGENLLNEDGSVRYENKTLTQNPKPCFSYAFCSDSRPSKNVVEQINGVDLVYHEATFTEEMAERAHQTFHSTAAGAARVAREAKVSKLILGHFSARYKELDPILEEAKTVFSNTELAIEGTKFEIGGE